MTTVSTHVLDAALGRPAGGIGVVLTGPGIEEESATDADGRVRFDSAIGPGIHRITFATGPWFAAAERDTFYPQIDVCFDAAPDEPHYHVALLLSPFAYSTYRGS